MFVVPHCLPLIRKFECHMNMEVAGCGQLFQYLFKYVHKGIPNTGFVDALRLTLLLPQAQIVLNSVSRRKTGMV